MVILEKENFLPESLTALIESSVFNDTFPWYFVKDITHEFPTGDYAQPGFHHTCFYNYKPLSPQYDFFAFLPHLVMEEIGDTGLRIFRMRIGLNYPLVHKNKKINLDYNAPHIDHPKEMKDLKSYIALYYINASDGDTFIFNETEESDGYTIATRISPKRGKLAVIDGKHYHASSSPILSDCRVVLTMNFHKL